MEKNCNDCKHSLRLGDSTLLCGKTQRPLLSVLSEGVSFNSAKFELEKGKCQGKDFEIKESEMSAAFD